MPFRRSLGRISGRLFRQGLSYLDRHPTLRQTGPLVLRRLGLHGAVRAAYRRMLEATGSSGFRFRYAPLTGDADALTRRTRQVLAQLRAARRGPKADR